MAKKIEKVIIPLSFEEEKGSLASLKTKFASLQKEMAGSYGKDLVGNLSVQLMDALKAAQKSLVKLNKPIYSKKEAEDLGKNISSAFSSVDDVLKKIKTSFNELFDPAEAKKAATEISAALKDIDVKKGLRERWTNANKTISGTGNKANIERDLRQTTALKDELQQKAENNRLTAQEIELLTELTNKEQEYVDLLDTKARAEEEIANIQAEAGVSSVSQLDNLIKKRKEDVEEIRNSTLLLEDYENGMSAIEDMSGGYQPTSETMKEMKDTLPSIYADMVNGAQQADEKMEKFNKTLRETLGIGFSLKEIVGMFKRLIREAFDFYKSLDQALTDITIVSNMSRSQVQELTQDFIKLSAQTGMAIDDIAQASVIFYQQGLNTEEVMRMTEVTAQFAKVAGSTVEKAADQLTAAINGYKVGVEGAIDVADKLNAVAAASAASIDELATAMSKAASQANQAGLSMDKFYAIIGTIEEVTREAPENIGTSLKTIMARMQQIKEGNNTEDETDVNDVETALKTVGISLRDTNGQLRDLEEVLDELGPKWNGLDRNTQAYLGTIIAGTRQQSRFISMMQNWDRVLELTEVSQNSAGRQALMHEKAMQGLDAAINTLTNSWQKFLATLTNSNGFITLLKIASKLLDNLSQMGSVMHVVTAATNLFLAKNISAFKMLGNSHKEARTHLKLLAKEYKAAGGPVAVFKKHIATLKDNLKQTTAQYNTDRAALEGYTMALRNKVLGVNEDTIAMQQNELAEKIKTATDSEALNIQNDLIVMTGEETSKVAELIVQYNALTIAKKNANQSDTILTNNISSFTTATKKSQGAMNDAQNAMSGVASTAMTIVGGIQTLVSLLGFADDSLGQLVIGLSAATAAMILFNTTNPVGWISMAITAVTALFNVFKIESESGAKGIRKAREEIENLQEEMQNITTKKTGLEDYLEEYDKLTKKIFLTKEEQEKLNDVIQNMGDLADVKIYKDANGNNLIDRNAVEQVAKNLEDDLAGKMDEAAEAASDMFKAQFKDYMGQSKWCSELAVIIMKSLRTSFEMVPIYGWAAGLIRKFFGIKTLSDGMQEELERGYIAAYERSQDYFLNFLENYSQTGNATTNSIQRQIYENMFNSEDMKQFVIDNKGDGEAIAKELQRRQQQLAYLFENPETNKRMSNALERGTEFIETSMKEANEKTLKDLIEENDRFYETLLANPKLTDAERLYIEQQKAAGLQVLTESFGLTETDIESIKQKYGEAVAEILMSSSGEAINTMNKMGLLNGDENSNLILQQLIPDEETQQKINQAFASSADDGYKAVYARLQELISSGQIKGEALEAATEMRDELAATLGAITVPTWKQWGNELKDITQETRDFASALDEIRNGKGLSFDGFVDFMDILDNNASVLGDYPELFDEYINAVDKMVVSVDDENSTLKINGETLDSLEKMENAVTQAKLENYKKELQLNLGKAEAAKKAIDAEKARVESQIKSVEVALEALGIEADADGNLTQSKALDFKTRLKNLWHYKSEVKKAFTAIVGYENAKTQGDINSIKDTAAADYNSFLSTSASDNSTKIAGKYAQQIKNLYNYRNALDAESKSLETQITTLQTQIRNWDKLKNVNWSKWGNSKDKKKTTAAAKDYVAQLSKIAALLTHIEQEEAKINTLESIRAMQTGKANIKNLLEEIKLTEHLQKDYVEKYNLERKAALDAKKAIKGKYGKVVKFNEDGSYSINEKKYKKMSDKEKKELDEWIKNYLEAVEDATGSYDKIISNIQAEMKYRQEAVDAYIEGENKLVEAIKTREKKILDAKLAAIDKELKAIDEVADARRKAREEENDAAEMSGLQVDLQRALMDSSGASASQILALQKQIKDKQKEMADNSFDNMVDDMRQQLEDEKQMEQDMFDERLEEMDWYWAEVDRIMGEGVESVMDTMKLYSEEYNQASEVQQTEILKGWTDTFEQAVVIGKLGAQDMQVAIQQIQDAMNALSTDEVEAALNLLRGITAGDFGIQDNEVRTNVDHYASGGMNYKTGLAWLDGSRSNPEAVLSAAQTKAFLSFTDDLAALRASGAITNNANVIIDTISFNVESMSSPEDGEKAFDAFVDRFKQIGAKRGVSVKGTANRF